MVPTVGWFLQNLHNFDSFSSILYVSKRCALFLQNGEGMPYELEWGVDDEESGNSYSHVESSDGDVTRGEYRVLLPDGRTQVVTFFDDGNGYNAEVTYEKK